MRGLRGSQRVHVKSIQSSVQCLEEANRDFGSLNAVLPEWELIKLPYAVPVVFAQCVEELERLHQVYRADHHVVVPAAEVVIDVDREQSAGVDAQLRCIGWGFQSVHGMSEVEQDAQIVQADLLDAEQGTRRVRKDDLVTWFARLVFDHELDLRVRRDQLAQPVDRQLPDVVIVDLEGIVPAILPEPQLDVIAAQILGQLRGLVEQLQGLGAYGRIGVGDRAFDVVAVVDLRRYRNSAKPIPLERGPDVIQRPVEVRERPVQVDNRQVTNRASLVDPLKQPDRRTIALSGITVLVGGEVPNPSAEDR